MHTHAQLSAVLPMPVNAALDGRLVHWRQAMSLVALHGLAIYWPMEHTLHVAGLVLPGRQKAVGGHPIVVDGSGHEKPAGHGLCCVEPAGQ